MKIEIGKWYRSRSGFKSFVGGKRRVAVDPFFYGHAEQSESDQDLLVEWQSNGLRRHPDGYIGNSSYDLIEEWKEPKTGVMYVNVYPGDSCYNGFSHATRKLADDAQVHRSRIACVRVPWTEGQFDE